jgi:hypothetical protein
VPWDNARRGELLSQIATLFLMDDSFSADALQSLLDTEAVGRCVLHLASVSSTMDVARQEAEDGAPHGLIVVADEQTGGQGRRGRRWVSPPGNLYVTIVLRPAWSVRASLWSPSPLRAMRQWQRPRKHQVAVACSLKGAGRGHHIDITWRPARHCASSAAPTFASIFKHRDGYRHDLEVESAEIRGKAC